MILASDYCSFGHPQAWTIGSSSFAYKKSLSTDNLSWNFSKLILASSEQKRGWVSKVRDCGVIDVHISFMFLYEISIFDEFIICCVGSFLDSPSWWRWTFSIAMSNQCIDLWIATLLTPKGPRPFFGPFLKFGQAIVDAIFVQKI
jgi:hypothetical protein